MKRSPRCIRAAYISPIYSKEVAAPRRAVQPARLSCRFLQEWAEELFNLASNLLVQNMAREDCLEKAYVISSHTHTHAHTYTYIVIPTKLTVNEKIRSARHKKTRLSLFCINTMSDKKQIIRFLIEEIQKWMWTVCYSHKGSHSHGRSAFHNHTSLPGSGGG